MVSLPAWERGLKLVVPKVWETAYRVAPWWERGLKYH